ncbi:hypothetical protein OUZ56_024217 [Daphnia magna]|uniref:Uncharacterized protein n=1 Tax=Daphnia magna TaxID=35525 RepID=A0ABR0B0C7_9CRUS|nr:hypothetical protein OUZ56_024217 [Daphnia magna]
MKHPNVYPEQKLELKVKLKEEKSKALKSTQSEQLSKLVDSSTTNSFKITANTNLIEGFRTEVGVSKAHLRTIKKQVIDKETRVPDRPQTSSFRKYVSTRSVLNLLEATLVYRRNLLYADVPPREQPSRLLPIMSTACGPSHAGDTSSDTSSEHLPPTGNNNHSHGGCCNRPRTPNFPIQPFDENSKNDVGFKAKFRAIYENEYEGSPALLFMLEELLSKGSTKRDM